MVGGARGLRVRRCVHSVAVPLVRSSRKGTFDTWKARRASIETGVGVAHLGQLIGAAQEVGVPYQRTGQRVAVGG